jgi:uncharacterized iron-regulated protein
MRRGPFPTRTLVIALAALGACAGPGREPDVPAASAASARLQTAGGDRVAVRDAARELAEADVVFLGELHDSDPGHVLLAELFAALCDEARARGRTLTLSMEPFERDVQDVVDDYVLGRISEQRFLDDARPWRNYAEHYRPLVEQARERGVDVVAANVPRRIAARVARYGLESGRGALFAAASVDVRDGEYRRRFDEVMSGAGSHGSATDEGPSEAQAARMFAAQALKDDTMAESIERVFEGERGRRRGAPLVVHLCGRFHSDFGLGTVERLVAREPGLDVALVSMVTRGELGELGLEPTPPAPLLLVVD